MGIISIWHWLIVAFVLGGGGLVTFLAVKTARRGPEVPPDQISGIGGWLFLLAVGQCIAPLRLVFELVSEAKYYRHALARPSSEVLVAGELLLHFAVIAFQVYVAIALLRRWKIFPKLFLYQWLLMIAWPVIDIIWVHALTEVPIAKITEGIDPLRAAANVIMSGAWVWYTFASVRVRNTFTK